MSSEACAPPALPFASSRESRPDERRNGESRPDENRALELGEVEERLAVSSSDREESSSAPHPPQLDEAAGPTTAGTAATVRDLWALPLFLRLLLVSAGLVPGAPASCLSALLLS